VPVITGVGGWVVAATSWREQLSGSVVVVVFVLVGLISTTLAALRGHRGAALLSVPFALAWLLVNRVVEGPVLIPFTNRHGITLSDLLAVAALCVAGWRLGSSR
jgi:hypothetical protein